MWLHVLETVLVTDRVVAKTTPTRAVPTPLTTGALDPLPPPESPTGTEETGTGTSTHAHDRDRGDRDRYRYKEILINRHCVNEWQEYFLVGVGEKCASTAKILASVSDPDPHY